MIRRIAIIGTGLIGASIGLAVKETGFAGEIVGWDANPSELATAVARKSIDRPVAESDLLNPHLADVFVLATPVLPILHWMQRLAPVLGPENFVTDVGSTKAEIAVTAAKLFNQPGRARFLPGHPMAGKESGGAALAEPTLFYGATWLFTPASGACDDVLEREWYGMVSSFGAQVRELDPQRHDTVCAWVSHLPQMVATALASLLEETFTADPAGMAAVQAIGGRALREMTRLGASPYSMWRDVSLTNTENLAATLLALEQQLAHLRENLRTPQLRDLFTEANRFRKP